jgi:hypothetical protein
LRLILYYIKERFIYFFPLTIFSKCIAFHSYWVCIHWNEMYKTKCNRCASVFFSVHSPEMKCTKPSYRCLHLRRNTLEKNTIYSYTRTLIGQKNFPNLPLTDKTFFFWLTPWQVMIINTPHLLITKEWIFPLTADDCVRITR